MAAYLTALRRFAVAAPQLPKKVWRDGASLQGLFGFLGAFATILVPAANPLAKAIPGRFLA